MSISKLSKFIGATLCFMVSFVAVSCSSSDESENLSPEEDYDYPITGHWVHSLQDYDSYLILNLEDNGTGTECKRYHGIMEYEIPILYEYKKGSLTIISDKNGSRTYKCQWIHESSFALETSSSRREYWDRSSSRINTGDGLTKYELTSLIPNCVSIKSEYRDFIWHVTIESTLHTVFPNAEFDFQIGHGRVEGGMIYQSAKSVWRCSTSYEGKTMLLKMQIPYWYYYWFGKGDNANIAASMGDCYLSYENVLNDEYLTKEEERFKNDLAKILSEYEPEAKANYVLEVVVKASDTNNKWDSFIRSLRLSDDCK